MFKRSGNSPDQVTRPDHVKVKALDENMEEYVMEETGLLARAILS